MGAPLEELQHYWAPLKKVLILRPSCSEHRCPPDVAASWLPHWLQDQHQRAIGEGHSHTILWVRPVPCTVVEVNKRLLPLFCSPLGLACLCKWECNCPCQRWCLWSVDCLGTRWSWRGKYGCLEMPGPPGSMGASSCAPTPRQREGGGTGRNASVTEIGTQPHRAQPVFGQLFHAAKWRAKPFW